MDKYTHEEPYIVWVGVHGKENNKERKKHDVEMREREREREREYLRFSVLVSGADIGVVFRVEGN